MIYDLSQFQYIGVSAYAGMHPRFDWQVFIDAFRSIQNPCIAVVWGTFGNCPDLIHEFCARFQSRPHLLEIHISNEVGRRNGRLYEGELCPSLNPREYSLALTRRARPTLQALEKRISHIREFCAKYCTVNTRIILSTGLEDNVSNAAALVIMDTIAKVWQRVEVVRSPADNGGSDPYSFPYAIETHSRAARPGSAVFNFDGHSVPEAVLPADAGRIMRKHKTAVARFLWSAPQQGLYTNTILAPPPRRRKFSVLPSTIETFNKILRSL